METTQLNSLLKQFGGVTDEYKFYNGEVVLRFDTKNHEYLKLVDGELVVQPGVTSVVKILDKSNVLIAWAARVIADKVFRTIPDHTILTRPEFERLILEAKKAPRDKVEEAADIGHIAHDWIEQYIKRELKSYGPGTLLWVAPEPLPDNEKAASCCKAALDWMSQHNVRWIHTERKIYSQVFEYAGTLDGVAIVDSCTNKQCCPNQFQDRKSLIDWKSSNGLYVEYLLQTAAYQQAYEEETDEEIEDRWVIRLGKLDGEFEPWHVEGREFYTIDFETFEHCLHLYNRVDALEARVKAVRDRIKAAEKAIIQAEREAQLKIKCKSADKYKGTKVTKCLPDGSQCQACKEKYQSRHPTSV